MNCQTKPVFHREGYPYLKEGTGNLQKIRRGKIADALQVNTDEIFPDLLSQWKTRKNEKVEGMIVMES